MSNFRAPLFIGFVLSAAVLCRAQGTTGASFGAAGDSSSSAPSVNQSSAGSTDTVRADNRAPSGVQPLGLGITGKKELNIAVNGSESWDSNSGVTPQSGTDWEPLTTFGGTVSLRRQGNTSLTSLNYSGQGIAYPNRNPAFTTYQGLGFAQSFQLGRWQLLASDAFNFSPNAAFGGFGTVLLPPVNASAQPVLNPQYVPNQSIFTPYGTSLMNTVAGQIEYGLSRRSSWTASGSYGILEYTNSGFYNTHQMTASTGYNYSFTAKDSISVSYIYNLFNYDNFNNSFYSNSAQISYSRRVTGRIALQLGGGPQFISTNGLGVSQQRTQFAGNGLLSYSRARTSLSLTYFSGMTGGSSVLLGSTTDQVQFTTSRQLSREWSTAVFAGYSRNTGLIQPQQKSYDSLYLGTSLNRALGKRASATFSYSYQRQIASSNCVGVVCGDLSRNFLTLGISYSFRPIRLE